MARTAGLVCISNPGWDRTAYVYVRMHIHLGEEEAEAAKCVPAATDLSPLLSHSSRHLRSRAG